MDEKFKRVLRFAVHVCELRKGDIDTEDGPMATTDTDSIINLEAALCDALDTQSDDIEIHEVRKKIQAL